MPRIRPKTAKKTKHAAIARIPGRLAKPSPKLTGGSRRVSAEIGEIVRKRAEAEAAIADARKSHERLREAIELLPQGIVFLDAEGRYILWNKKYAEIYSRSSDQFKPGARLQDTIRIGVQRGDYPEAVGREEEWITERIARLYQPGGRHEQTLADGRCILIEERLTGDGGIIGLRVDITELKQREASFRLLFDSNPVPMIVCALDDERILGVNDAAVEHYGYSRVEFERLTIRSVQAFESEPPWAGGRSSDELAARTWKHVRADGTLIDLAIYSRQLVYREQPAVLLALMDITERKRAEEERERLRQIEADLVYTSRVSMMGELAASLAHEIRQPISAAAINGETCKRWLQHAVPNLAEAVKAASAAVANVMHASAIIDRISSLYRRGTPERELVDLNEIVREMSVLLGDKAKRSAVSIRTDLDPRLPVPAADRVQLQQVVMNLMLNGVEAMQDSGGELWVASKKTEDGRLLISVSDTGAGLSADDAEHIFDAFFTTKLQGTGMGLSISRRIITSHGGHLWATPNAQGGAIFQFTLPAGEATARL